MKTLEKDLKINSLYYKEILAILKEHGGNSRLIGGCVRDALLGLDNPDIDIATNLHPQRVMKILESRNILVVPTGIKYGTVTAVWGKEKFEITTLRRDLEYRNGRHPEVEFSSSFKEDAARRDFTINALSYCPFEQKVYDYFGGLVDLKNSRVVFIGDPLERINEDFLRILRFFRFSCLYAKILDKEGLAACVKLKEGLKVLSKERIKTEFDKLISVDSSPDILQVMNEKGILAEIILFQPLVVNNVYNAIKIAEIIGIKLENYSRYSLLFYEGLKHDSGQALKLLAALKFSNKEAGDIIGIIEFIKEFRAEDTDYFFRKIWFEKHKNYLQYLIAAFSILKLDLTDIQKFNARYEALKLPVFPVKGNDLISLSLQGRQINDTLKKLKTIWIENDFQTGKEQLLDMVK